MEIDVYQRLFSSLQELARDLSYPVPTKFDEFVDFYEYLKTHHPKILYEDEEYYEFDDLEENLKDFATKYEECSPRPWKLGGLLNIQEEVSHMLTTILVATQESIQITASQQLFTLEEIKQTTKEALKEFLLPDSTEETCVSKKEREQLEHQKAVDARLLEETIKDSKNGKKGLVQGLNQKNKRK